RPARGNRRPRHARPIARRMILFQMMWSLSDARSECAMIGLAANLSLLSLAVAMRNQTERGLLPRGRHSPKPSWVEDPATTWSRRRLEEKGTTRFSRSTVHQVPEQHIEAWLSPSWSRAPGSPCRWSALSLSRGRGTAALREWRH